MEARSPALIEQVRTAVTDGNGQYRIVALEPGAYSVTFSLAGFRTLVREGIELETGFNANVDAEMAVGQLAETITVTESSPVIDVQSIEQSAAIDRLTVNAGLRFDYFKGYYPGDLQCVQRQRRRAGALWSRRRLPASRWTPGRPAVQGGVPAQLLEETDS